MRRRLKPLKEQVIVITGATSGIGLATAKAAAKRGASVVLASRAEESLIAIVAEIEAHGGKAMYLPTDVRLRKDLEALSQAAIERYGGFDTWINNAGTSIFGNLEQIPEEDHRNLFETNFWGLVNGSLVALEHLKHRGGALINLGSVASDTALPGQGMYAATKHAVKGFTDSLRVELEAEQAPISITLIKPASINTPFPHRARNYMDQEPKLPAPVYSPEIVAEAILHAAETGQREIYVGGSGRAMSVLGYALPSAMDWIGRTFMLKQQRRDEPPRQPEGSLNGPQNDGHVYGDEAHIIKICPYTQAAMHPVLTAMVCTLGVLAAATFIKRSRGHKAA